MLANSYAAKVRIREDRLSRIACGRDEPRYEELEKSRRTLGRKRVDAIFRRELD